MGLQESRYVNCFYDRFPGRIAIGVGYNQEMMELFPIVVEDDQHNALGIVAMAALSTDDMQSVHILHLSVFLQNRGNGTRILDLLCEKADKLNVILSLSPIPSPNGEDHQINDKQLVAWYRKFGFTGETLLCRKPQ
jgi:hypothetical protein